jgi:methyl-accepting chemotaxis protein
MTVPLGNIGIMETFFQRIRVNVRDYIFTNDDIERKKYYDRIFELKAEFDKISNEYEKSILTKEGRDLWQNSVDALNKYMLFIPQIEKHITSSQHELAIGLMKGDMLAANQEVQKALDDLRNNKINLAKITSDDNTTTANKATLFL